MAACTRGTRLDTSMRMASMVVRARVRSRSWRGLWAAAVCLAAAMLLLTAMPTSAADAPWPKYLHDNGASGQATEGISTSAARNLEPVAGFPVRLPATVSTQPVLANGLIYVGDWDGNEYALTPSGAIAWKHFLGITTKGKACQYPIGIAGTPVVASVGPRSMLFVGGGGNADQS